MSDPLSDDAIRDLLALADDDESPMSFQRAARNAVRPLAEEVLRLRGELGEAVELLQIHGSEWHHVAAFLAKHKVQP